MSKPLNKMTKIELIQLVNSLQVQNHSLAVDRAQLEADVARLRGNSPSEAADGPINLSERARQYCAIHGVKSVDRQTLLNWRP